MHRLYARMFVNFCFVNNRLTMNENELGVLLLFPADFDLHRAVLPPRTAARRLLSTSRVS